MAEGRTPDHYYSKLVGETFTGKFIGTHELTSVEWLKIRYDRSPNMESYLQEIKDKFEGRIWKGFHNGCLYIKSDEDFEENRKYKLRIDDYICFEFEEEDWIEGKKYRDHKGYHLTVTQIKKY